MVTLHRAARFLCCTALALPVLGAQPTHDAGPVFGSGLDLVRLTVTVRDEKGNLIPNLEETAFKVYEDGRPQKIQVFARSVEPGHDEDLALDLGLLFDTSESMLDVLKLSQEAAVRFLEAIPRARDLLTIFFDQDIRISRFDSENQQGLIQRIFEAKSSGNTSLYDAIAVYLSRSQEGSGRKVLVVFTDGDDTSSQIGFGQLRDLVRSSPVTIYPIAFAAGMPPGDVRTMQARAFLLGLAETTGGRVFSPTVSKDLPDIYQKLLEELESQYVIGFLSDNPKADGRYRKLKVEVDAPRVRVSHRQGYTVPKEKKR